MALNYRVRRNVSGSPRFRERVVRLRRLLQHAAARLLAMSVLASLSTAAWAHECGSPSIELGTGRSATYRIQAFGFTTDYSVQVAGDSLVTRISPLEAVAVTDGVFEIVGVSPGTTTIQILWDARNYQEGQSGTCTVEIRVTHDAQAAEVVTELVPEVCPVPEHAQAFLYPRMLEPGDRVASARSEGFSRTVEGRPTYFGWIDCGFLSRFEHAGAFVFIEEGYTEGDEGSDLALDLVQTWPVINGAAYLDGAFERLFSDDRIFGFPAEALTVEAPGAVFDPIIPVPTNPRDCAVVVHGTPFDETERRGFHHDVDLVTAALTTAKTGPHVDPNHVISLKGTPADEVTDTDVLNAIASLNGKCDRIFFWYSGHAFPGGMIFPGSALGYDRLAEALYATGAQEFFVFIDACSSATAWEAFQADPAFSRHHLHLFTATDTEKSARQILVHDQAGDSMMVGFFTRSFTQCWSDSTADSSGDGQVSPDEAYEWVLEQDPEYDALDPNTGQTVVITVKEQNPSRFHFIAVNLTLCGQKFNDLDGDGERDADEPGEDGFEIELYDENGGLIGRATTASQDLNGDGEIDPITEKGRFCFEELPRGRYVLKEVPRLGWEQTYPTDPATHTVDLATGSQPRILFGNHFQGSEPPAHSICGQKFDDLDGNGARGAGEPGLGGFVIELLDDMGNVIARTTTGSTDLDGNGVIDPITEQGRFCFDGLPDGTYTVREVQKPGWQQTAPAPPGTYTVTLPTGSLPPMRFGNYAPADSISYDWGDLPDPRTDITACAPPGCYPTLDASNGPSHALSGELWLGAAVDAEVNGQPTATADGDVDDGLVSWSVDNAGSITFNVIATIVPPLEQGIVEIWVDINDDGDLVLGELVVSAPIAGAGTFVTPPGVASTAFPGFVRMRLSSSGTGWPVGPFADGEVEDYLLAGADFGDAPGAVDPTRPAFPGGYPTSLAQNGARHAVVPSVRLGEFIDAQADVTGQHDALEDDRDRQQDDEDGIRFLEGFTLRSNTDADEILEIVRDDTLRLLPLPSTDGMLDSWVDWNGDGDWEDDGEQIFISEAIRPNMMEEDALSVVVPPGGTFGYTYARFRFSRIGNLSYDGAAADGEVEDYLLRIVERGETTSGEVIDDLPRASALHAAYPNPFSPVTEIRYDLSQAAGVRLAVYDALGREVAVLVERRQEAGEHRVVFTAEDLSPGVYFYRLRTEHFVATQRMVLIR